MKKLRLKEETVLVQNPGLLSGRAGLKLKSSDSKSSIISNRKLLLHPTNSYLVPLLLHDIEKQR